MELNYNDVENAFKKYIEECKNQIKNLFFSDEEIEKSYYIKSDLLNKGKIGENTLVSDAIKKHRNELIDIKLNHTMRVVKDVTRISEKMELNVDFEKVLKVSALLHDIGRFPQAINSNDFNDKKCNIFNGMSHAEYGYQMLYINKDFDKLLIPEKYRFVISQPVRYHQIPVLTGELALLFEKKEDLDINKYLTGNKELNMNEKIIVAALVQMVKDVDMLDILYQHLTGEFPVIKKSIVYDVCGDSLEEISKHFGISKNEIKEYNGLNNDDISNLTEINIPIQNINPVKLTVPKDIQDRFFNNENIDLKELQARRDWTFITGMWWRLNHFLNNINFVSNLEVVKENELLEKIYETYPDKYKPLVYDAFCFTKEELIDKSISNNKGQIYKIR